MHWLPLSWCNNIHHTVGSYVDSTCSGAEKKKKRKEKSTPLGVITGASVYRGSPGLLLQEQQGADFNIRRPAKQVTATQRMYTTTADLDSASHIP